MSNFFDNKARATAASSSKTKPTEAVVDVSRAQPWVEKYRPRTLDEVKGQSHATEVLRRMVNAANMPHIMAFGPAGVGKTSAMISLCRELFGPELMKQRVLELNASSERSIDVIRGRVKQFAAQHLISPPADKEYRRKYPCPPFKMIILDECENFSSDAQSALRRVMELYSATTRFCLCTNYVTRIIEPIASRCTKFRFKALSGPEAVARIEDILAAEGVKYDEGVIPRCLDICDGDLRRAITMLQSAARLAGASQPASNGHKQSSPKPSSADSDEEMEDVVDAAAATAGAIRISDIDEIAGTFPPQSTDGLIKVLRGNRYNDIAAEVVSITAEGYAANEVLSSLYNKLLFDDLVDFRKKYKLTQIFSEIDKRLVDGVDEQLAMMDLSCQIAGVLAA